MLSNLFASLQGKKTYILAGLGVVVALIGHFFGPVQIGDAFTIPQLSWTQVWNIVWNGGLFAALRSGVASTTTTTP